MDNLNGLGAHQDRQLDEYYDPKDRWECDPDEPCGVVEHCDECKKTAAKIEWKQRALDNIADLDVALSNLTEFLEGEEGHDIRNVHQYLGGIKWCLENKIKLPKNFEERTRD